MNTLKDNQSLDLLVLKELITRMTGSEALEDVSESQAQAMAGGDVLRSEAINFNNATPPKARAKGIARLRDALQRGAKGRPAHRAASRAHRAVSPGDHLQDGFQPP